MIKKLLAVLILMSVWEISNAGNVTFDSVVNSSTNELRTTPLTTDGYIFSSAHFHILNDPSICIFGGCASNGTQYLGLDGPTLAKPIQMTSVDGKQFNLFGLDATKLFINDATAQASNFANATQLSLVGMYANGISFSDTFNLNGTTNFQHISFSLLGLQSVSISGVGDTSIAIDNLQTISAIPEAEEWAMMMLGLGMIGFVANCKKERNIN